MPTFKIVLIKKNKRKNGDVPIRIRVIHNREIEYICKGQYAGRGQYDNKFNLTDPKLLRVFSDKILEYKELIIKKFGLDTEDRSISEIIDCLSNGPSNDKEQIDFVKFCREFISQTSNTGTADVYNNALSQLIKFYGNDIIYCFQINKKFLQDFEAWLKIPRKTHLKSKVEKTLKPASINNYMRTLGTLFSYARKHYNDYDREDIKIPNDPFRHFELIEVPLTKKLFLTREQIRELRDTNKLKWTRELFARDIALLSFYTAGTNSADLYNCTDISKGRMSYERQKTKSKRKDNAFFSIKLEPEVLPIIEKYKDKEAKRAFIFYKMYSDPRQFNKALNKGLQSVAKTLGWKLPLPIRFYAARNSYASFAHNKCELNEYDVGELLNHVHKETKVTRGYIEKDWSTVDRGNRAVLDYIK